MTIIMNHHKKHSDEGVSGLMVTTSLIAYYKHFGMFPNTDYIHITDNTS